MSKQTDLKVLVIVPAYNEAKVIGSVIKEAQTVFDKAKNFHIDIVVINDGSEDASSEEAKKAGALVINHILNSGVGSATATGLAYAKQNNYNISATMDADGQHSAEDVLQGIENIIQSDTDLLIGSRLINSKGMSRTKIIGNWGLSLITRLLFGVKVTDSQSGLRIFSTRAVHELRWKTNGYEFCSEMLWRAHQLDLIVDEYPIEAIYTDYSRSKGQNNWNAIIIIRSLIKRRVEELLG